MKTVILNEIKVISLNLFTLLTSPEQGSGHFFKKNPKQECIPVGCVACFCDHQMSVLVGEGVGPKFEQVSSDGHQMSLAGGTMSHISLGPELGDHVWCLGGGASLAGGN